MDIEFRSIRQQLDELFNFNEDQYRIDIINDKNDNWTGQWILTKNIAKDDVSYIRRIKHSQKYPYYFHYIHLLHFVGFFPNMNSLIARHKKI